MKKIVLCAMIMSLSLLAFAPAFAQADAMKSRRGMMGRHCISHWEMFKFMRDINITDSQKTELKVLMAETDNKTAFILAEVKSLSEQMDNTFLAAEIDTAAAETQIDDMLALQTQLADILLHAQLQAAQILTADQRALILEMITKLRECGDWRQDWMDKKKPSYFKLLMPEK